MKYNKIALIVAGCAVLTFSMSGFAVASTVVADTERPRSSSSVRGVNAEHNHAEGARRSNYSEPAPAGASDEKISKGSLTTPVRSNQHCWIGNGGNELCMIPN